MDLIKAFTEPDAIRRALELMLEYPFDERPLLRIKYRVWFPNISGNIGDLEFLWRLEDDTGLLLDVLDRRIILATEYEGLKYFDIKDMLILNVLDDRENR